MQKLVLGKSLVSPLIMRANSKRDRRPESIKPDGDPAFETLYNERVP